MKMPIKRLFASFASLAIACAMNAADATAVRYVVTLQVPQIEAAATAKDLAARYDGKVIPLTTQNFVGVAIETTPEAAARMAQDPRVSAVEAQFIGASPVNGPSRPMMLDTAGITTKGVAIPLPPALRDASPAVAPRPVEAHVTAAPPVTAAHASTSQLHAVANGTGDWNSGTYSYDGAGNIYAIGSNYYVYDNVGRLTVGTPAYENGVASNTNRQTFTYDAYGNMLSKRTYEGSTQRDEDLGVTAATNRLTGASYDALGNLTAIGSNTYEWDAFNDLTSKTAVAKEQYLYDADDERIATVATNTTTFTLRGPDQKVLRELTRTTIGGQDIWSWKRDYVYRDDLLMAEVLPGTDGTAITRHFHLDHLGTPRIATNELGARTSTTVFWPFGEEVATSVTPGTDPGDGRDPLRYTGHEYDPDPNGFDLNYMHARYELGRKGRFLSVDPAKSAKSASPQSWNRYAYAADNPMKFVDRNGGYYELASAADRQFFVDAITAGMANKEARELFERQAADPMHKIVLETGNLPGTFQYGDSSKLHGPYRVVAGNLFPSGITSTVDKGKLMMVRYPTPTITVFHELLHDDIILYQGLAANAAHPDQITQNVTTGQITSNSIFEDFGRAAATTANDPMHALSHTTVSSMIADPNQGKATVANPCVSILCVNK